MPLRITGAYMLHNVLCQNSVYVLSGLTVLTLLRCRPVEMYDGHIMVIVVNLCTVLYFVVDQY